MEARDFFDLLYQQWTKTTRAADTYWMPKEVAELHDGYSIVAVDKAQHEETVAANLTEADADFITAVHGCFGDLVKRMHDALDEADRADLNHDEREQEIFKLALENQELNLENIQLRSEMHDLEMENGGLLLQIYGLEAQLATARSKAADVLWKIERPM